MIDVKVNISRLATMSSHKIRNLLLMDQLKVRLIPRLAILLLLPAGLHL